MYYSENFFYEIEKMDNYKTDNNMIDIINELSNNIKPIDNTKNFFHKKKTFKTLDPNYKINKNFKATIINKKEGIDLNIDLIRKNLNKMSDITYDVLKDNIIKIMDDILYSLTDDISNDIELIKVSESIFNISTNNSIYSHLYAKLYKELIDKYSFIKENLYNNINNFTKMINNTEYIDPNINYDKYCDYKKKCEKTKSICYFYSNLLKINLLDINDIMKMISIIQTSINNLLDIENKNEIVNELSELLYIFIHINSDNIVNHNDWNDIYNNIIYISKLNSQAKISLSNKTIFKHMDILDILEDIM